MKFAHRDESAWEMGDFAYDLDDTIETGITKAQSVGIYPGSDGYAAFMTAFSRRVRSKKISERKLIEQNSAIAQSSSAELTPACPA
jgi:hypothetical protein